ncbi:MAG: DUF1295 domain-containing protein [Candidatus Saccharibacteria bacterium]|nr:DUF1295 domain-containing protein [Candidatus Saccharibacteria bacterium]
MPTKIFLIIVAIYSYFALTTLLDFHKFSYVVTSLAICLVATIIFISCIFLLGRKMKRYDIIDAAWGPTFIVVALTSFFISYQTTHYLNVCMLVVLLVIIWGGRLSWHIGRRILNSSSEDPRYTELRKNWKGNVGFNVYFRVYIVQAILATTICIPVIHINLFNGSAWTIFTWIGLVIWCIGFIFEVIGDSQLKKFVSNKNNRGKIMQSGLWRYSRHPNYFGEITQWWGIGIIAIGVMPWWVGLIGPLTITFLILYISGIPPSEKRFEGRAGWSEYKAKTSVLVPLPVKKV